MSRTDDASLLGQFLSRRAKLWERGCLNSDFKVDVKLADVRESCNFLETNLLLEKISVRDKFAGGGINLG